MVLGGRGGEGESSGGGGGEGEGCRWCGWGRGWGVDRSCKGIRRNDLQMGWVAGTL